MSTSVKGKLNKADGGYGHGLSYSYPSPCSLHNDDAMLDSHLLVRLNGARGLVNMTVNGVCNPYIKVRV